jgi:cystathionine gamma-synthase
MNTRKDMRTIAASNGVATDSVFGAVAPPLYLTSTFEFSAFGRSREHEYTRTSNPTRAMLADTLAKLEGGVGAVVTASGMAAVDLVLSLLRAGERIVAPHDCYAGTYRLLAARAQRGAFDIDFVDQGDQVALDAALNRAPVMVLVETPSNPLMRIVDIRAICAKAKSAGAKVVVDNTFLSPALQRPLSLGADFVVHSTTKYLNGHSDVVGGAVIAANERDFLSLSDWANITGVTGAPYDSHLTLRGLRTLFPRMERQQASAMTIAEFLAGRDEVSAVHYPGLIHDPGHVIAAGQQDGFGAMLSFQLAGGLETVARFVDALSIFTLAESLGGVESLIAHPASMTHISMGVEARHKAGISDTLLRLSVGLEAEGDLLADLRAGLTAVRQR